MVIFVTKYGYSVDELDKKIGFVQQVYSLQISESMRGLVHAYNELEIEREGCSKVQYSCSRSSLDE